MKRGIAGCVGGTSLTVVCGPGEGAGEDQTGARTWTRIPSRGDSTSCETVRFNRLLTN